MSTHPFSPGSLLLSFLVYVVVICLCRFYTLVWFPQSTDLLSDISEILDEKELVLALSIEWHPLLQRTVTTKTFSYAVLSSLIDEHRNLRAFHRTNDRDQSVSYAVAATISLQRDPYNQPVHPLAYNFRAPYSDTVRCRVRQAVNMPICTKPGQALAYIWR